MQEGKKIAVAGATGRVGRHVVDVVTERGHRAVPMSRSLGVDLATGAGLAEALAGVEVVIDTASSPTVDGATEYFTAATRNLQEAGAAAAVQRLVVVSIIGLERNSAGYGAAKLEHERLALAGPVPALILRAAQFHEFVEELTGWGRQGDVAYLPLMRTQLVAARTVAEALVDLALDPDATPRTGNFPEIAGPREENLAAMAALLAARRGDTVKIEEVDDPSRPENVAYADGSLLPGPHAVLAGPTFADWLDAAQPPSR